MLGSNPIGVLVTLGYKNNRVKFPSIMHACMAIYQLHVMFQSLNQDTYRSIIAMAIVLATAEYNTMQCTTAAADS